MEGYSLSLRTPFLTGGEASSLNQLQLRFKIMYKAPKPTLAAVGLEEMRKVEEHLVMIIVNAFKFHCCFTVYLIIENTCFKA